jgi:hypothetical protein
MDRKNEGAFGTPAYMGRDTHNVGQYGGTSVADAFKSLKTPSSGLQKRGKKVEKEKSFADMFADLKGEK